MPMENSLKSIRTAIEEAAGSLFSEGMLSEKTRLAHALGEMQGLNLFLTAVPWRIDFPKGQKIYGLSETLQIAARDIHAQLITLERILSSDAMVSVGIDQARLPEPRHTASNTDTITGLTHG